jgi:hypothetical protein
MLSNFSICLMKLFRGRKRHGMKKPNTILINNVCCNGLGGLGIWLEIHGSGGCGT